MKLIPQVAGQMRSIRYQEIAAALRAEIVAQSTGSLLPSEAELSKAFNASRVTVRRALELLREEGIVTARQGFGWFVSGEPVRQRLERLLTIESQLEMLGRQAIRRVVDFAFVTPPAQVAEELGVDRVLRVERINLADTDPFAVVVVWCPAELGQNLSLSDVERRSFYELLNVELRGARQAIGADVAEPRVAEQLSVPVGSPVLKCRRVTFDEGGRPVLMSEHTFAAHRTEFVIELPNDRPSSLPAGLRLLRP
jgi:GntR family transcriptional regulator